MNRLGRATVLLSIGTITARLLLTGAFGYFVQQRMRLPLLAATIMLLILGISETVAAIREENRSTDANKRLVGPYIGWLLMLPILVLVAIDPTGLGAAAADRVEPVTPPETTYSYTFPPLPDTDDPLQIRIYEFLDRAIWDGDRSLEDRVIRLEGLVVNDPEVPDGFLLTRFLVGCCAADAVPLQIAVRDVGTQLDDDTWVVADVIWRPPETPYQELDGPWLVEADVVQLSPKAEAPDSPYESPY